MLGQCQIQPHPGNSFGIDASKFSCSFCFPRVFQLKNKPQILGGIFPGFPKKGERKFWDLGMKTWREEGRRDKNSIKTQDWDNKGHETAPEKMRKIGNEPEKSVGFIPEEFSLLSPAPLPWIPWNRKSREGKKSWNLAPSAGIWGGLSHFP